jgi:hypothetical protein
VFVGLRVAVAVEVEVCVGVVVGFLAATGLFGPISQKINNAAPTTITMAASSIKREALLGPCLFLL